MKIMKVSTNWAALGAAATVALTLAMTAPVGADAQYKPGPPPVWCGVVRFCPYDIGSA